MKPQRHTIDLHLHTHPRNHRPWPPLLREVELPDATLPGATLQDATLKDAAPPIAAEDPLKCVWSGYPNYDRDCRSRIPASVVVKAWRRERQLEGTVEGFFYFEWRSGVWLAFGVKDGSVRGVYCPTHCSERNTRAPQGASEMSVEDRRGDQPTGVALH